MKRFVFALGLLATVAVSESDAGYLVIRLVLQTAPDAAGGASPGGMPGMPGSDLSKGPSFRPNPSRPATPGLGSPGAIKPGALKGGPPRNYGVPMGAGAPMGPGAPMDHKHEEKLDSDPTHSIYVVVPYTNDITKNDRFYKKAPPQSFNPHWQPAIRHPFGYANLMYDNTQIQLYMDLGPLAPKGLKTRQSDLKDRHNRWLRNKDPQALLDMANDALAQGFVTEAFAYSDELVSLAQESKTPAAPQIDRFLKAYAQIKDAMDKPAKLPSEGRDWKERIGFAYGGVKDYLSLHYHMLYWEGMDTEAMRRISQLEDNFKAFYLLHAFQGAALPMPDRPLVAILAKSTADVRKLALSLDGTSQVADGFFSPDHGIVVLSPERLDGISKTFNRQIQEMFRQGVSRKMLLAGEGPKIAGENQDTEDDGKHKDAKKAEDVARMMTWTVVERYAEEEAEWSAVSREGSRQLLYAIGFLPRHVALPLWLSEGSASYYQRPRGPVFSEKEDHKDYITVSLTTGYGGPNFVRQKQFSELLRLHQFDPGPKQPADPGQVLRNAVTDTYFTAALAGLDADNPKLPITHPKKPAAPMGPGPMGPGPIGPGPAGPRPMLPGSIGPGPMGPGAYGPGAMGFGGPHPGAAEDLQAIKRQRYEFLVAKAQCTSWALYYYLAKINPAGLDRYVAELGKMPRDFPLDPPMQLAAFARAFDLALDGKRTDGRLTFSKFGADWLQWMETVPVTSIDVALTDLTAPSGGGAAPGVGSPGIPKSKFGG
jgi:hypothetical protein